MPSPFGPICNRAWHEPWHQNANANKSQDCSRFGETIRLASGWSMMLLAPDPSLVRVLIIEDEFLIALDLQETLHRFGFTAVKSASTVAEAVEVASWWRPHLLTADFCLPDGSGCEAARTIRNQPGEARVVTIYITGNPEMLAAEPGAVVLTKPLEETELREAIESGLIAVAADDGV
jgi:CheY-like chemotaxis protein